MQTRSRPRNDLSVMKFTRDALNLKKQLQQALLVSNPESSEYVWTLNKQKKRQECDPTNAPMTKDGLLSPAVSSVGDQASQPHALFALLIAQPPRFNLC